MFEARLTVKMLVSKLEARSSKLVYRVKYL
jgi:hypothetical protein